MPSRVSRRPQYSVDLALFTPLDGDLALLLVRDSGGLALPWVAPRPRESLRAAAARAGRECGVPRPKLLEQLGALDTGAHPAGVPLSVAYVGLLPLGAAAGVNGSSVWVRVRELPRLPGRQSLMIDRATQRLRELADRAPAAFRLLPPRFTLSELQRAYELLLGRRLHKASFRRALNAAWLVSPLDEWRSEGRGRPAQLYRFAPRLRRRRPRGPRFDLLGA